MCALATVGPAGAWPAGAGAVSQQEPATPQERPRFRADVGVTRIKAAVLDDEGEPLGGLGPADFRVWEDGVEQDISMVLDPVRFSLDVAVVLDFSTSVARDWSAEAARAAAHEFLDRLGPDDCVFLLPFNSTVGPGTWGQPDDVMLRHAVDSQEFENFTRLYDAILVAHDALDQRRPDSTSAAAEELEETLYGTWMEPVEAASCGEPLAPDEAQTRRAAMVVLTDGEDSGSRAAYADALMASWRSEVPIFAMGVGMAARPVRYQGIAFNRRSGSRQRFEALRALQDQLREIARVSGGQLVLQRELGKGYATTLGLLRGYYVIVYPSPEEAPSGWRELEVELARDDGHVVVQPGVFRGDDSHVGAVEVLREASVKFELGQYEAALADFDLVARFSPDIGAPYFGRAIVLERLGRWAAARDSYAESLRWRPGAPVTHARLAELSYRLGDFVAAWDHGIRAHVAGFNQLDLFARLEEVSEPPDDMRQRLEGPVVFVTRPPAPELESQLALRDVSRALLAGLDRRAPLAVTNFARAAHFTLTVWVRKLGEDGDLSARLVLLDLTDRKRKEIGLSIDDVGDPEVLARAVEAALDETTEWILDEHSVS